MAVQIWDLGQAVALVALMSVTVLGLAQISAAVSPLQAAENTWDNTAKQLHTLNLPAASVDIFIKQTQARGLSSADMVAWQRIMTNAHQ